MFRLDLRNVLRRVLGSRRRGGRLLDAAQAYDLWSAVYDDQLDNPLVAMDDQLFTSLMQPVQWSGRVVLDVGCGTGRHWPKLFGEGPARVVGYDVSRGMLARLRTKYPDADVHQASGSELRETTGESCDVVISTLTLGYLPDCGAALADWRRVLKPDGDILITDLHPALAERGARTFTVGSRNVAIRHHVHAVHEIVSAAAGLGLAALRVEEQPVNESVRGIFEARGAADLYAELEGRPFIYGLHLKKGHRQA
jgi:ubiquinone/menaquinone biosynthesis C-methylase UbiE